MTDNIRAIIQEVSDLTGRIKSIRMVPEPGKKLPIAPPGAHIQLQLPDGNTRDYSLVSFDGEAGQPDSYTLAVQLEPKGQGGSRYMHQLAVGDMVCFAPPKNGFPLEIAPAVFLAGGIGVTPLISMAAVLKAENQPFTFHYAGRSASVMAYGTQVCDHFDAVLHYDDDPQTALDLGAFVQGIAADRHLYICGPRGMVEAAKMAAEQAGIPPERIHFELFDSAAAKSGDTAFEVEISSSGEVFTIPPDKTIVEVLEAGGVDVMYDCQRGDCGICQVDVISGIPDHRDVVLSDAERDSAKVMQICVSRAKSPRLVLDI
jgi:vanillate O-demethylase ferredoxin subunit